MRTPVQAMLTVVLGVCSAWSRSTLAQPLAAPSASASGSHGPGPPAPPEELTAPALLTHPEAAYPPAALRERREAAVGLELTIDEKGTVTDVKVTASAGPAFDEAATAAARTFTFAPARRGGAPIRSSVQFTYEFHLPPAKEPVVAPPPVSPPPPPPVEVAQTGADQSTLVLASRPISAASSFSVQAREFTLRPIGSVQDILRVTPGLVVVQHSGGGKANQYFLRGFDADHGTDLALTVDGIPINMVSHAHGQGFADTNFLIPEAVERVEITKGPYFTNQGDFATAGAVNMVTRDSFEHTSVGLGLTGSPGHGALGYRGLLIASPQLENVKATFAAEVGRQNGPFDNPEGWDRYKLFNKVTFAITPTSQLTIGEMSYAGNWHGSGQIPARAVERGEITRFGSVDPDEGGNSARHQVHLAYTLRPTDRSEIKALTYVGTYRFNLYSDFTLYQRDPNRGDEIEQIDRRTFYGGRISYRVVHELLGVRFDTTFGGDGRNDDIHQELWSTVHRTQTAALRSGDVHETFLGAFVNEEISPVHWLRVDLGARADLLSFTVDDKLPHAPGAPGGGVDAAHQVSPKASVVVSPLEREDAELDVYANYGHGFHSNDVRGVFARPAVTPLARAVGEEIGSRARLFQRWDLAVALWQLDLASETVWNGDDGTTQASGATTRRGVELETRFEFTPWLAVDGSVTFTRSAFTENHGNGNGLALAPKQTWAGGLSARHDLGPGAARAGLRFYGIGDRPASDDGALVAPGFTQVDVHLGYRVSRFDVAFDVENLLDATFRSAQFDTVSRLRTEPALGAAVPSGFSCGSKGRLAPAPAGGTSGRFYGCEDVNFTPAYPLTMRLMATVFLD